MGRRFVRHSSRTLIGPVCLREIGSHLYDVQDLLLLLLPAGHLGQGDHQPAEAESGRGEVGAETVSRSV